jgi:tetratricopeptide (TPR) repeat protein
MKYTGFRLAVTLAVLAVTHALVPCISAQSAPGVLERAAQKFAEARFDEVIGLLEPERARPYPPEMVYRLLASAYLMEGEHGKALSTAEEGTGHYPRSTELQVLHVDALSRGQPGRALQELRRIISDIDSGELYAEHFSIQELELFEARIHSLAGRTALEAGKHDQASAHFEAVAELQPMEPSVHHQLLYAYLKAGEYQDLLDAYDRAPSWLQEDRTMVTLRSQALLELRDVGELSEIYRKLHEENPEDLELAMTYGQLLLTDGKVAKANDLFNEILEKHPGDRRVYDVLMDVNRRQFNYEGMAVLLDKMIRFFPEDPEPSLELARIRELLDEKDRAVALYDSLILYRGPE